MKILLNFVAILFVFNLFSCGLITKSLHEQMKIEKQSIHLTYVGECHDSQLSGDIIFDGYFQNRGNGYEQLSSKPILYRDSQIGVFLTVVTRADTVYIANVDLESDNEFVNMMQMNHLIDLFDRTNRQAVIIGKLNVANYPENLFLLFGAGFFKQKTNKDLEKYYCFARNFFVNEQYIESSTCNYMIVELKQY